MIKETYNIATIFEQLFPSFYRQAKLKCRAAYNQYNVVLDNDMVLKFHIDRYRDLNHIQYQLVAKPGVLHHE